MNDTVTRLMELADKAIAAQDQRLGILAQDYRQALQYELIKLFTPLSDEQITTVYFGATGQSLRPQDNVLAHKFARAIEHQHGIKGDSKRCPLCNYQHGHQIGCENNPVDIALKRGSTGETK